MKNEFTKSEKLFLLWQLSFDYCEEFIKAFDNEDFEKMRYFNDLSSCITKLMKDISKNG